MSRREGRREKIAARSLPPLLIMAGLGVGQVPSATLVSALTVITGWICMAFSVAVLVGHCALGED